MVSCAFGQTGVKHGSKLGEKYQDPFYDLTTNQKPFVEILPIPDQKTYRFLQNQEIHARTLEGVFNYCQILNPTNHLNWSLGYQDSRQQLIGGVELAESTLTG